MPAHFLGILFQFWSVECLINLILFYFYRRNSFIQMTGLDVDAEKDQESLAASEVASEMLDAPTPR